jgi:hypothetical protein
MERRLARGLALVLVAAAGALVVVRSSRPRTAAAPAIAARHVDAPLGRISCDDLPVKTPEPDEIADDEKNRPYHLLVRVHDFKTLALIDVDPARLVVRGAEGGARVGVGEYYFQNLPLSYTAVVLFDPDDAAGPQPLGPNGRRVKSAERNPVEMARGAITTCDLIVIGVHDLEETVEVTALVQQRTNLQPLEGATVVCGTQRVRTDASGRAGFAQPVTWNDLLNSAGAVCEGFEVSSVNGLSLPLAWIRRVRDEKTALFRLRSAQKVAGAGPIPPLAR